MAWWRKKVVSPARRAWAAVSTRVRVRNPGTHAHLYPRSPSRPQPHNAMSDCDRSSRCKERQACSRWARAGVRSCGEVKRRPAFYTFFPPLTKWTKNGALLSITVPFSPFPLGGFMTATKSLSLRKLPSSAGSGGSILKLHEDVQTCGYKDVQVMFEILTSELEVASHVPKHHHQRKRPPSPWPSHRSSSMIAAAQ
ncbi:hypothetical protein HU200_050791 [Digitaria exilis]|uniref:Uncharacterized protein n=1 Tax=Digitaria exilis TaxID=1010633 RepID=A0A835E8Q0_9POAL|nr:hypothetical protein HU200_050791 [Digitaria exilis]